jgi:hypothetical protein
LGGATFAADALPVVCCLFFWWEKRRIEVTWSEEKKIPWLICVVLGKKVRPFAFCVIFLRYQARLLSVVFRMDALVLRRKSMYRRKQIMLPLEASSDFFSL